MSSSCFITFTNEILPVAIVGVTDRCKDNKDYILLKPEINKVLNFYRGYGFQNIHIIKCAPKIGVKRNEVRAILPDGWSVKWKGYWGDYIDEKGVKQFSVFSKGSPWDYCFFARR